MNHETKKRFFVSGAKLWKLAKTLVTVGFNRSRKRTLIWSHFKVEKGKITLILIWNESSGLLVEKLRKRDIPPYDRSISSLLSPSATTPEFFVMKDSINTRTFIYCTNCAIAMNWNLCDLSGKKTAHTRGV